MTSPANDVYHVPVMAAEVVRHVVTNTDGTYLDLTVGGGGHLAAMAAAVGPGARLYGVDRDPDAVSHASQLLRDYTQVRQIVRAEFGAITTVAGAFDDSRFDGILLDLGVSSHQIDDAARGFAFGQDGPLDMRMDRRSGPSASDLINSADEKQLTEIIRDFGEERQAARLARAIVRERQKDMIRTSAQLTAIVGRVVTGPHRIKSLARVFQAFRIAVNHELDELRSVLPAAFSLLVSGGRLAVISYHSLEDRIVKRFYQSEARPAEIYGPGQIVPEYPPARLRLVTRKPVTPSPDEITRNPRARSAKLRVAEKV